MVYDDDKTICLRVRDKTECEKAAKLLKLSDQSAGVDDDRDEYPPHCYLYRGKDLYFNTASQPHTKCSRTNPCICRTTRQGAAGGEYAIVKDIWDMDLPHQAGYARITTKDECKKAEAQLWLSPYSNLMAVEKVSDRPPFCYLEAGSGNGQVLKFNENFNSQAGCDSSATSYTTTIGCIVKKVQRGAQVSLYNTGHLNKYCNVDVMPEDVTSSFSVEWDFTKKCLYLKDCAVGMPRGEWKSGSREVDCARKNWGYYWQCTVDLVGCNDRGYQALRICRAEKGTRIVAFDNGDRTFENDAVTIEFLKDFDAGLRYQDEIFHSSTWDDDRRSPMRQCLSIEDLQNSDTTEYYKMTFHHKNGNLRISSIKISLPDHKDSLRR